MKCIVLLLAQTNKRERTHLDNSVYRERRRRNIRSVVSCCVCVGLVTNSETQAETTFQPNSENI